jgi:hypothetical protein
MANEITISASLAFSKGGVGSSLSDSALQFDVSGTDYVQGTQNIGFAADEALGLGDAGAGITPGYCYIKNTDATNYVEVFGATGETATIKIKAGEVALFRLSAAAPTLQADTGSVMIDYLLIED